MRVLSSSNCSWVKASATAPIFAATSLLTMFFCLAAVPAAAQPSPAGCEFPIAEDNPEMKDRPSVAYGLDGGLVVVYESDTFSSGDNLPSKIRIRRFDSAGNFLGPTFLARDDDGSNERGAEIARDAAGDFVLVWDRRQLTDDTTSIVGRRLGSDGTFLGDPFQINSYTTGFHGQVDLSTHAGGSFFVWSSDPELDGDGEIVGRLGAADGTFLGPQMVLNSYTTGDQVAPRVTTTSAGDFLVVWQGPYPGSSGDAVRGRRFDSAGTPLGAEFPINTNTGLNSRPDVAEAAGDFLVVWNHRDGAFTDLEVAARRLDSNGAPMGGEMVIQALGDYIDSRVPTVSTRLNGEFVVAWNDFRSYYDYLYSQVARVSARTVDAAGTLGPVFQVSSNNDEFGCIGCNFEAAVATSPNDDEFAVVWGDFYPFGAAHGSYNVAGRRFDAVAEPTLQDMAIFFRESEDPTDGIGLIYQVVLENLTPCAVDGTEFEVTLPQTIVDAGYILSQSLSHDCQASGELVTCTNGFSRQGQVVAVSIIVDPLPNENETLQVSGTVTTLGVDPDLSNNSATQTTQVVRCLELTTDHQGKGSDPVADTEASPSAPCVAGSFASGSEVSLIAAPARDGWRVVSWNGTDDDNSTSRFNSATVPNDDFQVTVRYGFEDGVSWWTADGVLEDSIGPYDLTQVGAGDVFDGDGNQGQAFRLDGDPILRAASGAGLSLGETFTLGFWLKVEPSSAEVRAILDKRIPMGQAEKGFFAHLRDGRPALRLGDGNLVEDFVANQDVEDGLYHFVVYRFAEGGLDIFIDGALDSHHDAGALGAFALLTPATVGSTSFGAAQPLEGLLDEIFFADVALSVSRLAGLYGRPLGYWAADGNALDGGSLGLHGVLTAEAGYTQGRCDRGFDLSSAAAAVTVPSSIVELLVGDMAFAAWLRAADADGSQVLLERPGTFSPRMRLSLEDGVLQLQVGNVVVVADQLGDLRDGELHHVATSHKPLAASLFEATLWVDGASQTFQVDQALDLTGGQLVLGGSEEGPAMLDEVYLFEEFASPLKLQQLRQQGCLLDLFVDGFESGDTTGWSASTAGSAIVPVEQ